MKDYELDIRFVEEERPEVKECKGLFFRGYSNIYTIGAELHIKKGFRLLKRKSCTGCPKCDHYSDMMRDMIPSGNYIIPDPIIDGGLYTVRVGNVSTDWESGFADDWDYIFEEVRN